MKIYGAVLIRENRCTRTHPQRTVVNMQPTTRDESAQVTTPEKSRSTHIATRAPGHDLRYPGMFQPTFNWPETRGRSMR